MKLNIILFLLAATVCLGAMAAITEHADASVRIAPIGDSITRGGDVPDSPYPSYRYYLWNTLRNGGYDVDFVGSTTDPTFRNFAFDQDHDGYSGYRTETLANDIERILAVNVPDVVLLDIGTNDVLQQVPMNERMRNVEKIVTAIRAKNPNVRLLIAQISPTGDTFRNINSGLDEYNQKILELGQRMNTVASPIVIVDMNTAWSPAMFTQPDGIHPNNDGEMQLAQRWANALISTRIITPSVPTPAPTVVPTTLPTVPPATTLPTQAPTVAPTAPPVTVQPTTVAPVVTPSATATTSSFGKRYAIGNPGSYIGSKFSTGGTGGGSSPGGATVTTGPTLKPGSIATGIKPPAGKFVRWYPAARWAAGLR